MFFLLCRRTWRSSSLGKMRRLIPCFPSCHRPLRRLKMWLMPRQMLSLSRKPLFEMIEAHKRLWLKKNYPKNYPKNPKNIQPNSLLEGQKDSKRPAPLVLLVGHEFNEPKSNPNDHDLDDQRSQRLSDSMRVRRGDAQRGLQLGILCLSEAVLLIRFGSEVTSYWQWMKLYENWIYLKYVKMPTKYWPAYLLYPLVSLKVGSGDGAVAFVDHFWPISWPIEISIGCTVPRRESDVWKRGNRARRFRRTCSISCRRLKDSLYSHCIGRYSVCGSRYVGTTSTRRNKLRQAPFSLRIFEVSWGAPGIGMDSLDCGAVACSEWPRFVECNLPEVIAFSFVSASNSMRFIGSSKNLVFASFLQRKLLFFMPLGAPNAACFVLCTPQKKNTCSSPQRF